MNFPRSTAANPRGIDLSTIKFWDSDCRPHDKSEIDRLADVLLAYAEPQKKRKRDDEPEEQLNFPATGEASSRPKRARRAPKAYEEEPTKKAKKTTMTRRAPPRDKASKPAGQAKRTASRSVSRAAAPSRAASQAPAQTRAASQVPTATGAASQAPTKPRAVSRAKSVPATALSAPPPAPPTTATMGQLVPNGRGKMVDPVKSARAKANWAKRHEAGTSGRNAGPPKAATVKKNKAKGVEYGDAAETYQS